MDFLGKVYISYLLIVILSNYSKIEKFLIKFLDFILILLGEFFSILNLIGF